jgi:hypothetical protein
MSTTISPQSRRRGQDHLEPEAAMDPHEQRKLRGHLEQIDLAAFTANREVLGRALPQADLAMFQRMAVAAANARGQWIAAAVKQGDPHKPLSSEQTLRLAELRNAYEELADAYEGLRRLVERGYLAYRPRA